MFLLMSSLTLIEVNILKKVNANDVAHTLEPQLANINIDVRLYNEEEIKEESEMEKIAYEFFGENVSFE